ncbi:MAG: hypothetical protein ABIG70_02870 [Pseudomonadota bacterium]
MTTLTTPVLSEAFTGRQPLIFVLRTETTTAGNKVSTDQGTKHEVHTDANASFSGTHAHSASMELSPVDRIYPHLFDDSGPAARVRILIQRAIDDANIALEAFGEADLEGVGTRLTYIASTMSAAYEVIDFNESLAGAIAFLRRSTVTASGFDVSRSALNCLVQVLNSLRINPMVDLDEAAELVDTLSREGWNGEHLAIEALIAALIPNSVNSDDGEFEGLAQHEIQSTPA